MRLSDSVTVQDVAEAVRLMKVAMQQSSIDPRTGQIDMDLIISGGRSAAVAAGRCHVCTARSTAATLVFRWPRCWACAGVSAADRTMKAQLVGELRSLLERKAGPSGIRIADLLDSVNAQSSVRVTERDLRVALNELVSLRGARLVPRVPTSAPCCPRWPRADACCRRTRVRRRTLRVCSRGWCCCGRDQQGCRRKTATPHMPVA